MWNVQSRAAAEEARGGLAANGTEALLGGEGPAQAPRELGLVA